MQKEKVINILRRVFEANVKSHKPVETIVYKHTTATRAFGPLEADEKFIVALLITEKEARLEIWEPEDVDRTMRYAPLHITPFFPFISVVEDSMGAVVYFGHKDGPVSTNNRCFFPWMDIQQQVWRQYQKIMAEDGE